MVKYRKISLLLFSLILLSHIGFCTSITADYDDQDRLIRYGNNTYEYTSNGELTKKVTPGGTTIYTYDGLGNLSKVVLSDGSTIEYVIDGENRRIGKKVNGKLIQGFLYDPEGFRPLAELDGENKVVSRFVYGVNPLVPEYMIKNGITYRIICDRFNPRIIIDVNTGTIVQQIDYDPFGVILSDTNPGFQPFGFAGGLYDRDTRLIHFGVRDYDAIIGRWLTKDPIGFGGQDTNLYRYVNNDPINMVDPEGLLGFPFKGQAKKKLEETLNKYLGDKLTAKEKDLVSEFIADKLKISDITGIKKDDTDEEKEEKIKKIKDRLDNAVKKEDKSTQCAYNKLSKYFNYLR